MAGGAGEYICPCGYGLLQAVAMYDAGFVVFRGTVSPFPLRAWAYWWAYLVGVSIDDKVLEGFGRSGVDAFSFGATADVGFFGGFGDGR